MCGIAGFKTQNTLNDQTLPNMLQAQINRGPDGMGSYRDSKFCGGMRRLSINGVNDGNQPLYNQSRDIVVFYNGEIYNHKSLHARLSDKSIVFKTHSDGEIIAHLYEQFGLDAFSMLDGMFAIALWDKRNQRLILARDSAGEKPLYYTPLSSNELVYASSINSLKQFPQLNLQLNRQAIWDLPTFLWIPEPATIYEHFFALERGGLLIADDTGIEIRRFQAECQYDFDYSDEKSLILQTKELVHESVESRLMSDVPVGSFLSGGLDSGIVTAIAANKIKDLSTYSIAFENLSDPYHGTADESPYAKLLASRFSTKHNEIRVTADTFHGLLDKFVSASDQPFAVSSGLGILAISQAAREQGIKVLLGGDGADEAFGGYSWYSNLMTLPSADLEYRSSPVSMQYTGMALDKRLSYMQSYDGPLKAWAWHYYASESDKHNLLNRDMFSGTKTSLRHFSAYKNSSDWNAIDYIRQDREFYFPNEMLAKMDRMTMAYSIEGRSPFASNAIRSFVSGLRFSQLVSNNKLKYLLKQAFKDMLPAEIIERPKHGFNVPIDHWLKSGWAHLMEETFSCDSMLMKSGILATNAPSVAKSMLLDKERISGHTLLTLIMLNKWLGAQG